MLSTDFHIELVSNFSVHPWVQDIQNAVGNLAFPMSLSHRAAVRMFCVHHLIEIDEERLDLNAELWKVCERPFKRRDVGARLGSDRILQVVAEPHVSVQVNVREPNWDTRAPWQAQHHRHAESGHARVPERQGAVVANTSAPRSQRSHSQATTKRPTCPECGIDWVTRSRLERRS